ncbi:hypothetical protein A1O3_08880 [Capronia epimyces CBS 606.96]|uniref:N-acetyltransferase domain-containing protein n=1 Tax=Capronia epimyces CBS 606.96 TaxID=1182542 RepID=W9XGP4_9EURO|nr:uncharacterized protein A1O3_08880 [Capronia epimyces CBS 606.96]EXJ79378.1 hypothetical protein A1O3_08880 [Capronia epimyces CBS 606.96]
MHVRPAQARDLADLATNATHAMFDDELTSFMAPYRHQHPLCLRQRFLARSKARFYSGSLLLAAVTDPTDPWWDGTEKIVGYLSATPHKHAAKTSETSSWLPWNWNWNWNALEVQLLRVEDLFRWYAHSDRSISRANNREFLKNAASSDPFAEIDVYWKVDHLSVDPSCQRCGIGSALMKHIQRVATSDNLPIVLLASDKGRPLYQKLGFADLRPIPFARGLAVEAMVWYPEKSPSEDSPS